MRSLFIESYDDNYPCEFFEDNRLFIYRSEIMPSAEDERPYNERDIAVLAWEMLPNGSLRFFWPKDPGYHVSIDPRTVSMFKRWLAEESLVCALNQFDV